ncbi:MAG: YvrJ protein family protein [Bacteriophage sp.]|nr:MAG: YvrJ protein family protein [Bacteriophage sp.]
MIGFNCRGSGTKPTGGTRVHELGWLSTLSLNSKEVRGDNMEWIQAISQLFSSLGVPVACLAVTFYLWYKETENHKEEIQNLTEVLNNNTMAIQKLVDKLDAQEG